MSNLANIAIGLIVVGLLLVRQLQPRPARETSSIRLVLFLAAAGIADQQDHRHPPSDHRRGGLAGGQPDGRRGTRRDPRGHGQDLAGAGQAPARNLFTHARTAQQAGLSHEPRKCRLPGPGLLQGLRLQREGLEKHGRWFRDAADAGIILNAARRSKLQ